MALACLLLLVDKVVSVGVTVLYLGVFAACAIVCRRRSLSGGVVDSANDDETRLSLKHHTTIALA